MMGAYGIDIASYRLDDLDRAALHFALDYKGRKVAVDIGCGEGRVAKLLALIGFEVYAYDLLDMQEHFAGWDTIHFIQDDVRNVEASLPSGVVVAVAQRTLHHIPYKDAQNILRHLSRAMQREGRLYLSLSGLHSKLAEGYEDADKSVEERFGEVGVLGKEIYRISDKVCLYTREDAGKLLETSGWEAERIWESDFGNIKSVSLPRG